MLRAQGPDGKWENVRGNICERLNLRKVERTLEILNNPVYRDMDVIFMQEVAGSFVGVTQCVLIARCV